MRNAAVSLCLCPISTQATASHVPLCWCAAHVRYDLAGSEETLSRLPGLKLKLGGTRGVTAMRLCHGTVVDGVGGFEVLQKKVTAQ